MIILFDKDEKQFTSLGLGVLTDAISCVITEELNGSFELEMEYPIVGAYYSELKEGRIILAPPNDIQQSQPFRIYKITKPIDGTVTIYCEHISYDTLKVPVRPLAASSLEDLLTKIPTSVMIDTDFVIQKGSDKPAENNVSYKTYRPYDLRSLLLGNDDSILKTYTGEYLFDRFNITLYDRRGKDRDFTVRYAKNMTDVEVETSSELMFNGVCPFYANTSTSTKTSIGKKYKEIYISNTTVTPKVDPETGEALYPKEWLSYTSGGSPIEVIVSLTVTNIIATEGTFHNHLVRAKKVIPEGETEEGTYFYDVTYTMAYINPYAVDKFGYEWLYANEEMTQLIVPVEDTPYRIFTPGDKMYKIYLWKGDKYEPLTDDDNIPEYPPSLPTPVTTSEEKNVTLIYEGEIIYLNEVRAEPDSEAVERSSDWLYEIEELDQFVSTNPRWRRVSNTPIVPQEGINYKVPQLETYITAYPIEGVTNYTKDWLTLEQGSTDPLVPVDGQGYKVIREDLQEFYYRWNEENEKYIQMRDTRYTYTNYVWNSKLQQYINRDNSTDKILTLDLSDKFTDTPEEGSIFQKKLYDESIKYMTDYKLGELKESVKVSFFKLSSSPEYSKWKELEKVDLGDTVHIIYEDMNINVLKKVNKIEYNVLTKTYDSIELGEAMSDFTDNAITVGANISALTNDRKYADITTVTSLVADSIKAGSISADSGVLTEAQIQTLTSDSITANIITASTFEIDKLVSELLVADNAAIKEQLTVGKELVVNGEMNIHAGSITMTSSEEINDSIKAYINPNATAPKDDTWLIANIGDTEPIDISSDMDPETQESIHIYNVYDEYEVRQGYFRYHAHDGIYGYVEYHPEESTIFQVDGDGKLFANDVKVAGKITATSGDIGGCTIEGAPSEYDDAYIIEGKTPFASDWLTATEGGTTPIIPDDGDTYRVYYNGGYIYVEFSSIADEYVDLEVGVLKVGKANIDEISADQINGGTITASSIELGKYCPSAIQAYTLEESVEYSATWLTDKPDGQQALTPDGDAIYEVWERTWIEIDEHNGYYTFDNIGYYKFNTTNNIYSEYNPTDIELSPKFEADDEGNVHINYGEINIGEGNFKVDVAGNLSCRSINIIGGEIKELIGVQVEDAEIENLTTSDTGEVNFNGTVKVKGIEISADTNENYTYVDNVNYVIDTEHSFITNDIKYNPVIIQGQLFIVPDITHFMTLIINVNPASDYYINLPNINEIIDVTLNLRMKQLESTSWTNITSKTVAIDLRNRKYSVVGNKLVYNNINIPNSWFDKNNLSLYEFDEIPNTNFIQYNDINPSNFTLKKAGIDESVYRYFKLINLNMYYDDDQQGYFISSQLVLEDSDYECSGILNNIKVSAVVEFNGRNNKTYTVEINQTGITFDSSIGYADLNPTYVPDGAPGNITKVTIISIDPPGYYIEIVTPNRKNLYIQNGIVTPKVGHENSPVEYIYADTIVCDNIRINQNKMDYFIYATIVHVSANSVEKILLSDLVEDPECGQDLRNRIVSVTATLNRTSTWTATGRARDGVAAYWNYEDDKINNKYPHIGIVNNYNSDEDINIVVVYK